MVGCAAARLSDLATQLANLDQAFVGRVNRPFRPLAFDSGRDMLDESGSTWYDDAIRGKFTQGWPG
jgi:hypothetical protein